MTGATHSPSNEALGIGCLVGAILLGVGYLLGFASGAIGTWLLTRVVR